MANIKGITIKIGGDTTELQSALKGVNTSLKTTQTKLRDVNSALKLDPKNTELLKQKQELLADAISKTKEKIETLKKAQEQAAADMKNGVEGSKEKYDALTVEISKAESSLKGLEKQADNTNDKVESLKFDSLSTAGQKMTEVGDKMSDVGSKVSVVSAAFVALGAAAVAAFSAVDEGADNVIKKTGATGEVAEELNAVYEQVASNVVGDFSDIGNVVGELNTRFGLTGDELETLSEEFMRFSTITDQDANSAVVGVAKAMNIFNVDASECANVLGLLAKTSQATGIDVSTLESLLQSNAATFNELGLDISESVQLMGTFEAAGADSATVLAGLKRAATSYSQEGKSMSEGLSDLISRLQDSSTSAEATAEAYDVFGSRAGLTFINLAKQGKISFDNLSSDLSGYATVVQDTYNATLDGSDTVTLAWQKAKLAASKLGETLDSKLGKVAEKVGEKIEELAEWFEGLTDAQVETLVKVAAIIAIGGPLIIAIGKVTSAVGTLFTLISAHPIGALITALGLAAAGIALFASNSNDAAKETAAFREEGEKLVDTMKAEAEATKEANQEIENQALASQSLWYELQNIVDANGKIKEGDETRAQVIADQLNQALGTEITIVDGIVQKYDELKTSVDKVIQSQMQQALIEQNQDSVTDAYANKSKSLESYSTAYNKYIKAKKEFDTYEKDIYNKGWGDEDVYKDKKAAMEDAEATMNNYAAEYGKNVAIINAYTDLQTAIYEGDYDKMQVATDNFMNALAMTPEEYAEIGEQVGGISAEMLSLAEDTFDVTASTIERGTNATNDAIKNFLYELGAADGDVKKQAQIISQAFEDGLITEDQAKEMGEKIGYNIGEGICSSKAQSEVGEGVDETKEKLADMNLSGTSHTWGSDLVTNLSKGIDSKQSLIRTSANNIADIIYSILHHSTPDVGPLKHDDTWMPDMMNQMAKGIDDNKWRVMQSAVGLASDLQYTFGNLTFTPTINNQNDIYLDSVPIASQVNRTLGALV